MPTLDFSHHIYILYDQQTGHPLYLNIIKIRLIIITGSLFTVELTKNKRAEECWRIRFVSVRSRSIDSHTGWSWIAKNRASQWSLGARNSCERGERTKRKAD